MSSMSRAGSAASSRASTSTLPAGTFSARPSPYNSGTDDSSDEDAWDEVDITADARPFRAQPGSAASGASGAEGEGISIVISRGGKKGKKKGPSDGSVTRERKLRQERHKAHAAALFVAGLIRNKWCNDLLLKARLLSVIPYHLQHAFTSITKDVYPNVRDRSRLFDSALKDLLSWWYQYFDLEVEGGILRRLVSDVDAELARKASELGTTSPRKGKGKGKEKEDDGFNVGERINSPASMAKHAKIRRGTRDISAQLFTAICRALDIPARLVFSLQPVDWKPQKKPATPRPKKSAVGGAKGRKGRPPAKGSKAGTASSGHEDAASDSGWEDGRGKLNYKLPPVNLRRSKPKIQRNRSPSPDAYDVNRFPVFWTEVWTRANREWITVDPTRKKMRCRGVMEPPRSDVTNQLLYVVAYEEDGSTRDVTARYAKNFNTTTLKARVPSRRGTDFISDLLQSTQRKFKLNRDITEDEELGARIASEAMPTSAAGFKNHPTYFLEQHLKRDEVLLPYSKRLGTFKGTEAVYPRSAVVTLKSTENYWRVGRVIKEGEIPMKWVKNRVVTIRKKREEEALRLEGEEADLQPLYAEKQTMEYEPPPVVDGKIPKNDFGNIDLFVPSMLPKGAVHLPNKTAAKCAKALGIDYADAIIGFEFRQRRALPTIAGVVVAQENAELLIEAVISTEQVADQKEFARRQDRVLARWKKLVLGLRIRQRIQASYNSGADVVVPARETSQFNAIKAKVEEEASSTAVPAAPVPTPKSSPSPTVKSAAAPKAESKPLLRTKRAVSSDDEVKIIERRPKRVASLKANTPAPAAPPPQRTGTRSSARVASHPTRPSPLPVAVEPPKRSTSGRTLRFTMSTEQAVRAKEDEREKARERERLRKEADVITDTEDDLEVAEAVQEGDGGSDTSLEYFSDF